MSWNLRILRGRRFVALSLLLSGVAACGKGDSSDNTASGSSGAGEKVSSASGAEVQTQPADRDPCTWMTQAEVEAITGLLERAPFRNHGSEEMKPEPDGETCAYVVPSKNGSSIPSGVYVEVATHDGTQITAGVMGALRATAGWLPPGYNPGDTGLAGPWDQAAGFGKRLFTARQGDAAVMLTGLGWGLPKEQLGTLAARMLAKIPDLPTAAPAIAEGREQEEEPARDPCSLVTAAEAEAVLGKLTVPPYASRTSTSMASARGGSCSYRTAKHHVLVLSPTWEGGKMEIKLAGFTAQQTAKVLGGTSETDTLDGPWDQVAGGALGEVYFLKGDALVSMQYNTSSTDIAGAVSLARVALANL